MSASFVAVFVLVLAAPRPEPVAPVPDAAYSLRVNRAARGVGIGIDFGPWGRGFGQRLHVDIPLGRRVGQFFGVRLQGTIVHPVHTPTWDPSVFGGIEFFGRSPVFGGIARIYGGGGVFFGGRPNPTGEGARYGVAGGGHLGIEVFAAPWMSFSVEIGGQGPVHALGLDGGPSVMGGINFWLGR
ncbi:hypothetical protein [Nannocystis sp. SCPEA4]|uniref:hypothetical protein n=1 Tax=Nannocystis sp. SCPEA4 TaxID=2996787 RepID=UPI0022703A4B|nr:hypothetical protein [Nannocystis sp. SCPEA4]MCY1059062.1 hypothetical protein [Nannocystis sp. SCPEA4]